MVSGSSRIALTVYQGSAGDRNSRATQGAKLLGEALAGRIGALSKIVGEVAPPLGGTWQQELARAQTDLRKLATAIESAFTDTPRRTPVAALNRCAAALATLPVIIKHRPHACVVWFDAHGDLNTPATTTTGYLGGMVITGAAGLWESGLGKGLDLANVVLVGARDLDPAERALIDTDAPRLVAAGSGLAERLDTAIAGRAVYVHVDCDVLEPGIVRTEYSVPGGLTLEDLHAACEVIARHEVIGFEIAELEATADEPATGTSITALLQALAPLTS